MFFFVIENVLHICKKSKIIEIICTFSFVFVLNERLYFSKKYFKKRIEEVDINYIGIEEDINSGTK